MLGDMKNKERKNVWKEFIRMLECVWTRVKVGFHLKILSKIGLESKFYQLPAKYF